MELLVGNLKHTKVGIRCDRASVLGNPFEMKDESQRDAVIQEFRQYLYLVTLREIEPAIAVRSVELPVSSTWKTPSRVSVMSELDRIKSIAQTQDTTLLCWCAPRACHCDVIVNYLNYIS